MSIPNFEVALKLWAYVDVQWKLMHLKIQENKFYLWFKSKGLMTCAT